MKKRNDLFDLIKSMTRAEKRYFKIYASTHKSGEHNCVRLFDAIDAGEKYDEKELRRALEGAKFIKQLGVQKNYLYNLILRSLREYRSGESVQVRINEILHGVKILFAKGLYSQCVDLVAKAREIASGYDRLPKMLEVINWEINLALSMNDVPALTWLRTELHSTQQRLDNLERYTQILLEMTVLDRTEGMRNTPYAAARLEELINDPLLRCEQEARSFSARLYFFAINGTYHRLRGEWERAHEYSIRNVRHMESHPGYIADDPRVYVSTLLEIISASSQLGNNEEAEYYIGILESLDIEEEHWKARIFSLVQEHRLSQFRSRIDFRGGAALAAEIMNDMRRHERHIEDGDRKAMLFNLAYMFFGAGDNSAAIRCLNIIFNETSPIPRSDINRPTEIFALMIHYDLGHDELIASSVRSQMRALRSAESGEIWLEKFMLTLLGRLAKSPADRRRRLLMDARDQLASMTAESALTRYLDVEAWIEGRLRGMNYGDVVREKFERGEYRS